MQVILLKHLRKRGKISDVIDVKPGYARNYLLSHNIAIRATEENKLLIENQKHSLEEKNAAAKTSAEDLTKEISSKEIIFIKQASEDGHLFGSVTNKDIAHKLSEILPHKVSHSSVMLPASIKTIGIFPVEIELHAEVITNVLIVIARSETQAIEAIKNYKIANSAENSQTKATEETLTGKENGTI